MKAREQPPAFGIGADQPGQPRAAAERGDVVGRVAGAAGDHLVASYFRISTGASRETRAHLAVDELVGDQVADDEHAAAREAVDEREQALLALGFAGQRMDGTRYQHCQIEFRLQIRRESS